MFNQNKRKSLADIIPSKLSFIQIVHIKNKNELNIYDYIPKIVFFLLLRTNS